MEQMYFRPTSILASSRASSILRRPSAGATPRVCVTLGDVLIEDGDPGDPTERGGRFGEQWVAPDRIHEM
jgi:hypothetical protein